MLIKKMGRLLLDPPGFFSSIQGEGFHEPFIFLLSVSVIIAIFTPLVNYLGLPSTDTSAAYQAQIIAWRLTDNYLLPRLGNWAFLIEALLIVAFAILLAGMMSLIIHLLYRLAGGMGVWLNAWKAVCYGAAPCVLLGWLPYWSLFMGVWSLVLQFYYGPKVLYKLPEGRALLILVLIVGATLLEFALAGTTVGFALK